MSSRATKYDILNLTLSEADISPVTGPSFHVYGSDLYFEVSVSFTGEPTNTKVKISFETSISTTSSWHEVLRIKDLIDTSQTRIIRLRANAGTSSNELLSPSNLTSTNNSSYIVEGPFGDLLRPVTYVQELSGGTSPTCTIRIVGVSW